MGYYPDLVSLENILGCYGWIPSSNFDDSGELGTYFRAFPNLNYYLYENEDIPNIQLALIELGSEDGVAYFENEDGNIEAKMPLYIEYGTGYDYEAFESMLADTFDDRY